MRLRRILFCGLAVMTGLVVGQSNAGAATNFDVGAAGMSAYVIGGANNPTLTLTRGQTYTFTVTVGGHPFWLTTARGAGSAEANQLTSGVTNNGASPGTVTFVVPPTGPSTLFYQCSFHDPMGGTLTVVAAPSVPALGPGAAAGLAGLLLVGALSILRRRRTRA